MESRKEAEAPDSIAGSRVLIVEDDPFIQMELEATLADGGAVVLSCCTVKDALSIASKDSVDIAVLDFGLVNETSAEVARYLDAVGIPFLFYTGQLRSDARLAEWAAHPLLPKPSRPDEIVATLARLRDARRGDH